MHDSVELYRYLADRVKEVVPGELSSDADSLLAEFCDEVFSDTVSVDDEKEDPHWRYSMYSPRANKAVADMIHHLVVAIRTRVVARQYLGEYVGQAVAKVAKDYPEITDTEPRGAILDALDKECDEQGWVHLEEIPYV